MSFYLAATHSRADLAGTAKNSKADFWGTSDDKDFESAQLSQAKLGGDGHSSFSYIPRDVYSWDGENSWEWDYDRTLYFETVAGLGNRLRALGNL